jgi:serine/threonine protein kinase
MAKQTPGTPSGDPEERADDDASVDIFDQTSIGKANPDKGPLSSQGFHVRAPRSVTLGDFRILRKVGAGKMGAVYLAYQLSHKRQVALKVLGKHLARRVDYVARFYREAAMLERLDHPGIVRCYGVGEEHGFHYFAMEFVEGLDAAVLLRRLGGKFSLGDAVHIVLRSAEALEFAARQSIIHRDVSPGNILVNQQGSVKMSDLGLAKPTDVDLSVTESHTGLGTPSYMAPEQARDAKHADHRSDIYALGGVFYQFLTGKLPFTASSLFDLIQAKERGEYAPASQLNRTVPRRCNEILARMLPASPRDRYANYPALIGDLEGLGLANERLSFDMRRMPGEGTEVMPALSARPTLEVLLIYDELSYIPLVQKALQGSNAPNNLSVVEDGREALALVGKVGRDPAIPRPRLILVGLSHPHHSSQELLSAIKANAVLKKTPVRALSTSPEGADLLRAMGLEMSFWVNGFDDLEPLEEEIKSTYNLWVKTPRA